MKKVSSSRLSDHSVNLRDGGVIVDPCDWIWMFIVTHVEPGRCCVWVEAVEGPEKEDSVAVSEFFVVLQCDCACPMWPLPNWPEVVLSCEIVPQT